jgi:hypothetical protein
LAKLCAQFPDVPEHYLDFLRHVGSGSLGDNFMIYSGPVGPEDIFDDETAAGLVGIVFFGDNFAGDIIGFDTLGGWRLVGRDTGYSPAPRPLEARTVAEFIAQRLVDCE